MNIEIVRIGYPQLGMLYRHQTDLPDMWTRTDFMSVCAALQTVMRISM